MNFVVILTDTQPTRFLGCYGHPEAETPHLDRLAGEGILFEQAYTTCPLCTPARAGIFTGTHPQIAGAWCNNIAPHRQIPILGEIFGNFGYRAAYTGKWHLDGSSYFGDGEPGGGFEPDWWYDGKRYAEAIGPELFEAYRTGGGNSPAEVRANGFTLETMWGRGVADRAIDFLQQAGDDPFVLGVSFDEPHGPCIAPPAWWERFYEKDRIPPPPNLNADVSQKPALQRQYREELGETDWEDPEFQMFLSKYASCNSYIDSEIGRVIEAVERLHGEDTMILYTSDHGEMLGAHGLMAKGPMMYDEIVRIPFLVKLPGGPAGARCASPVSQVDILPTLLDYAGLEVPGCLDGASLRPALEDPSATVRERALIGFHRFAINHDSAGGFFPIRCATDGRFKLSINLMDSDEFYDMATDPGEMRNRIDDPACAAERDALHDWILEEMDRIRDPFRGWQWGARAWRQVRSRFYRGGQNRPRPELFSFQPASL